MASNTRCYVVSNAHHTAISRDVALGNNNGLTAIWARCEWDGIHNVWRLEVTSYEAQLLSSASTTFRAVRKEQYAAEVKQRTISPLGQPLGPGDEKLAIAAAERIIREHAQRNT